MRSNPAWEEKTQQLLATVKRELVEVENQIYELKVAKENKEAEIKGIELLLKRSSVR